MDSIKRRGKKERKKEKIESSYSEKRFINLAEVWMNTFQKSTQCQSLASTKWAWFNGTCFYIDLGKRWLQRSVTFKYRNDFRSCFVILSPNWLHLYCVSSKQQHQRAVTCVLLGVYLLLVKVLLQQVNSQFLTFLAFFFFFLPSYFCCLLPILVISDTLF